MAIAFDSTAQLGINPGTTGTLNFAPSGSSNLVVIICLTCGNNDLLTDLTVGGSSIFNQSGQYFIGKINNTSSATSIYMYWYPLGTDNSSKAYVPTYSGSNFAEMHVFAYTGAKQTSQPDNSATSYPNSNQTSFSMTMTPVAANSWGLSFVEIGGGVNPTASTNVTTRDATLNGEMFGDTNAGESAAFTQTWTNSSTKFAGIQATLAPVAAAASRVPLKSLLGVGT